MFRLKFIRTACTTVAIAELIFGMSRAPQADANDRFITVASTTSTRNSGLYEFILPKFTKQTGVAVRVIAVGTGQAIRLAKAGDADVLFVHHKPSEEAFIKNGFGQQRFEVMYNDFIIVGPRSDPARAHKHKNAATALKAIAQSNSPFTSRGDDSGTHKKELRLWNAAGIDVQKVSGGWYRQTGSGMGATLNTASAMDAYALSDRSTWLNFANKGNLIIISEGDKRLLNPYGVILVNPKRHPHVKAADGQIFIDWITSHTGQRTIASFKIKGRQAFFPTLTPKK